MSNSNQRASRPLAANFSAGGTPANRSAGVPPASENRSAGVPPASEHRSAGVPPASEHRSASVPPADQKAGTVAHRGWHSRGYQPHCDFPGLVQSLGFRLFDSVPSEVVDLWTRELAQRQACGTPADCGVGVAGGTPADPSAGVPPATGNRSAGVPPASGNRSAGVPPAGLTNEQVCKILCERIDRYADMGYGSCLLADSRIAELTENAFLHFDSERYDLLAWCVMSNHVHVLAVPQVGFSLSDILQSWKSYTAHRANSILGREGAFWFPNYFDEFMRTTEQMEATITYIEFNPVAAKLVSQPEQWRYSSAAPHHRERVMRNRCRYRDIDPNNLPDA